MLMGSAAKEDIQHNEVLAYVPNKVLITVERARSSEIGHIFESHDSVFKANEDRDFLTLLIFMMYEFQKGEKSFWYPYFEAVDPGILTCYWDEQVLEGLDDPELRDAIFEYRDTMDNDWTMVQKLLKIYSPDYFNLDVCTEELYRRCSTFIATRCFGWGLPTTIVAPIADSFNHSARSSQVVDFVNKRLHLLQNKIYAYHFNFDQDTSKAAGSDEMYDKESSKLKYNVKRLFKEDELTDEGQTKLVEGEQVDFTSLPNRYSEQEVFTRFKNLLQEEEDAEEFETEEAKRERFPDHGTELWGIGYLTSDHSEDDDAQDAEEPEDCATNEELRRKILSFAKQPDQLDFEPEEFEQISSNTRLREIYNYRWWSDDDRDSYFVMVNKSGLPLRAGEQLFYNYGRRSNAYLLQHYGFCLD